MIEIFVAVILFLVCCFILGLFIGTVIGLNKMVKDHVPNYKKYDIICGLGILGFLIITLIASWLN